MRVLWFTSAPSPAVCERTGHAPTGSGHWTAALLENLVQHTEVRPCVVTARGDLPEDHFEDSGVEYFLVNHSRCAKHARTPRRSMRQCARIVREWRPDLVHVHGGEHFYGLLIARRLIDVPSILSLQGLLQPYCRRYFGSLSSWEILKAQRMRESLRGSGIVWDYFRLKKHARRESEILGGLRAFAGRTAWDRAYVHSLRPDARYYEVGELLRKPFYDAVWDVGACRRHSIIFTNAGSPRRGTETLLEALVLLAREFPEVTLRLCGHLSPNRGYHRFLLRRIRRSPASHRVVRLGYLDADSMAREVSRSHVFVIPSHIENSPNSLCEAMMVGLPCVASYAGGMPSLIEEGRTGLFFPPGDPVLLADRIRSLFLNDDLAVSLGAAARRVAAERHSVKRVLRQLLSAYRAVLQEPS